MSVSLARSPSFLHRPLGAPSRWLLVAAALLLVSVYVLPLWNLTMFAPQYPDGLRLDIYSYKLVGGNNNHDISEINLLNHYIGMRDLSAAEFTEFQWMPFVIGALGLLFLRAAVYAEVGALLDVLVLFVYFSAFSLWSFAFKLYTYGHNLAPTASVKVDPFMPPVFGMKQLANFTVYSYPAAASYAVAGAGLLLVIALVLGARHAPAQDRTA